MWHLNFYKLPFLFVLIIASLQQSCKDPGFRQSSSRVTYYKDDNQQRPYEVHYFCHQGYKLTGSDILTCQPNGRWSSRKPKCIRTNEPSTPLQESAYFCQDPGIPTASVRFTYYNNTKFELGSQVKFTCNEGYAIRGHQFITCQASGKWSAEIPHCEAVVKIAHVPKHCPLPGTLENGKIVSGEDQGGAYLVGAQVSYECDERFQLQGTSVITCISGEVWDNPVPQCIPERSPEETATAGKQPIGLCKLPERPQHGTYTITIGSSMPTRSDGFYYPGTYLTYKCISSLYSLRVNRLTWKSDFKRFCLPTGSWSATEPRCEIVCGRSKFVSPNSPFVVFGTAAGKGAWPWQAAISLKNPNNLADIQIICGGVLISSQWVLTAAHCVCHRATTTTFPLQFISIYLGKYYRNDTKDDSNVQTKTPVAIYIHENYNTDTRVADIALILLDSPVTFTEWVIPACLPNPRTQWPTPDNRPGIITGWGYNENVTISDELRRGLMRWAEPRDCEKHFPDSRRKVLPDMYCAMEANEGGWSCQGDSGGPMVIPGGTEGNLRYVAEGLVGWGNEKCETQSAVFVRIRIYLTWIASYARIENESD